MKHQPDNPFRFDPGVFDTLVALKACGISMNSQDAEAFHVDVVVPKMETIKAKVRLYWPDINGMVRATKDALIAVVHESNQPKQLEMF